MDWVRQQDTFRCGQCGADMQRWIRLSGSARRMGEITFCPACSPSIAFWVNNKAESIRTEAREQ